MRLLWPSLQTLSAMSALCPCVPPGDGLNPPCVRHVAAVPAMSPPWVRYVPASSAVCAPCQDKSSMYPFKHWPRLWTFIRCSGPWHHQVKFYLTIAQPTAFTLHARWSISLAFILAPRIWPLQARPMFEKLCEVYAGITHDLQWFPSCQRIFPDRMKNLGRQWKNILRLAETAGMKIRQHVNANLIVIFQ